MNNRMREAFDTRYAAIIRGGITGRHVNSKIREITRSLSDNGKMPIGTEAMDFLFDTLYMGIAEDLFGSDVLDFAENCIYKAVELSSYHYYISLAEQAQRMIGAGLYRLAAALTCKFCANPALVVNIESEPVWKQNYITEYDELDFGNDFLSEFIAETPYRTLAEVFYAAIDKEAWEYFDIIIQNGKISRYYKPMIYCLYVDGLRRGNFGKLVVCVYRYEKNMLSDPGYIADYARYALGTSLKYAEIESRFASFDRLLNDFQEINTDSVKHLMRQDDSIFDLDNTMFEFDQNEADPES